MYMFFVLTNLAQQYNPFTVTLFYYSLWGACTALLSMVFSIIAIRRESWFRVAYISVEISYAVNTTIICVFWLILWPTVMKYLEAAKAKVPADELEKQKIVFTFLIVYQSPLHSIPWVSTVVNLAITDMTLNKRHWWIAVLTLCPGYMIANIWGSLSLGQRQADGKSTIYGTIYGVE